MSPLVESAPHWTANPREYKRIQNGPSRIVAGLSHAGKELVMTEDRLAIRLHLIRKEAERAIRNGQRLDPHLVHAMTAGVKA